MCIIFLTNIGYEHDIHNHWGGDFGYGLHTTSQIESLWKSLKDKIKKTYNTVSNKNFIKFLWEAEWKFNNKELNLEGKIKEFFEML